MADRITVVLDDAALKDLRAALLDSPRQFYAVANNVILPQAQVQVEKTLNRDPGPVKRPFKFATDKSRRWYFATHKAPYKRTGDIRRWRLFLKAFTGQIVEVILENPSPNTKWVYGDDKGAYQQPGHAATGYPLVAREVPALTATVLGDLSEAWLETLDPTRKRSSVNL